MQEYAQRRKRLMTTIGDNSIAIVAGAHEQMRNSDCDYLFRQNSDFYYLTGFKEPEALLVLIPGREQGEFIIFNRESDPNKEIWTGRRAGQKGACEQYGADQSFSFDKVNEELPKLLENRQKLYYAIGQNPAFDEQVLSWLAIVQAKQRSGIVAPSELLQIQNPLHEMRLIKSAHEIGLMQKAANISVAAHCRAMQTCKPGLNEARLEAEIQYIFSQEGSRSPAYNHIVAAGANACTLHYNDNDASIADGDLVLIDAGAEYGYYASDVTRTFPANGKFSAAQAAVYEAVLATQLAVIAQIKPGVHWNYLEELTGKLITEHLIALGILKGKLSSLLQKKAYQAFYMHRFGHWLGLDVHDVGSYKVNGLWRPLEPGMVLTVEPGIYIPPKTQDVDKKWWGIGIRIEDDILVTEQGCEVLSSGAPKQIVDIEKLMQENTAV